jgi:hypothetical protein
MTHVAVAPRSPTSVIVNRSWTAGTSATQWVSSLSSSSISIASAEIWRHGAGLNPGDGEGRVTAAYRVRRRHGGASLDQLMRGQHKDSFEEKRQVIV